MQMNPKLLQYSLDLKYAESKRIQSQHNQHIKKLQQITKKSNFPKIIKEVKSLKLISQSMSKYKQIARTFKQKEIQQKRLQNDRKMIKSLSEIHKSRKRLYTENQVQRVKYKQRKQTNRQIVAMMKSKQLEEQNLKIAIRLQRHQNQILSYKDKMRKNINDYVKLKKNIQRIKQDPLSQSMMKSRQKNIKKMSAMLTLNMENHQQKQYLENKMKQKYRSKNKPKCYTQIDDNENDGASSMSTKEVIAILNQRKQRQNLIRDAQLSLL